MKKLSELAWNVTEEVYREDKALSYSTISRFEKEGFSKLDNLFDKIESPSLLLGSMVDTIITEGIDAYNNKYKVLNLPKLSDKVESIIKEIFNGYGTTYSNLSDVPNFIMISAINKAEYYNNWTEDKRITKIKELGSDYYKALIDAIGKTVVSMDMHNDAIRMCEVLKTSKATRYYFAQDNPFEKVERYYQLKFKTTLNGIEYRCMADLILVNHDTKEIQLVDLKTSSSPEYDFYKNFIHWGYQIQNRLYYRIIKKVLSEDEYYKDFTFLPYKDIVVSKNTLIPLVWTCDFMYALGDITLGKDNQIVLKDPEDTGKELNNYLKFRPQVPDGINVGGLNDLRTWINKI